MVLRVVSTQHELIVLLDPAHHLGGVLLLSLLLSGDPAGDFLDWPPLPTKTPNNLAIYTFLVFLHFAYPPRNFTSTTQTPHPNILRRRKFHTPAREIVQLLQGEVEIPVVDLIRAADLRDAQLRVGHVGYQDVFDVEWVKIIEWGFLLHCSQNILDLRAFRWCGLGGCQAIARCGCRRPKLGRQVTYLFEIVVYSAILSWTGTDEFHADLTTKNLQDRNRKHHQNRFELRPWIWTVKTWDNADGVDETKEQRRKFARRKSTHRSMISPLASRRKGNYCGLFNEP
jgi:hypothetical protein